MNLIRSFLWSWNIAEKVRNIRNSYNISYHGKFNSYIKLAEMNQRGMILKWFLKKRRIKVLFPSKKLNFQRFKVDLDKEWNPENIWNRKDNVHWNFAGKLSQDVNCGYFEHWFNFVPNIISINLKYMNWAVLVEQSVIFRFLGFLIRNSVYFWISEAFQTSEMQEVLYILKNLRVFMV